MAVPQCMSGARLATGHIVEVEHSLNLERHVTLAFDETEVPSRIQYLRKIDQLRCRSCHRPISKDYAERGSTAILF